MQITFNLPHVFNSKASLIDNAYVLRALLDCLVRMNLEFLRRYPETLGLYQSGVTYGRTIWWEPIPALYERKKGDCKSLACALIAEYQFNGIPCIPNFRWIEKKDGSTDYHILVQTKSGFEDPSKVLGMSKKENQRFYRTDGTVVSCDAYGTKKL